MNKETRNCQNCHNEFVIEPDDFAFYEKMKVPPPTFCFQCRMQRRFSWRNERILFKRKCNAPGHNEDIISVFSPEAQVVAFDSKYWWSDSWDPLDYGAPYDFKKSFFEQYHDLIRRVPWIALSETNMSNCSYCNVAAEDKDCYLTSAGGWNERTMYANRLVNTKDSADLYISDKNELCYELVNCRRSYRLMFSVNCIECSNSAFLYECTNCQNCFGCTNLRSKQHYFFNEPFAKNEYEAKVKLYDLGSAAGIIKARNDFEALKARSIRRYARIIKSIDSTGDNIVNAKNARDCFDVVPSAENIRYCVWAGYNIKEIWDGGPGAADAEKCYEIFDTAPHVFELFFSGVIYGSYNVYYSINCHGSHHLFGCYGLRNKEYCILNKKYTKEEYEALIPKIIQHMNDMPYTDRKGRIYKYGEFLPSEISPFAYNETIANDYFPLQQAEAEQNGFLWRETVERDYHITKPTADLPDHIRDTSDALTNEVIGCAHQGKCMHGCATAFKITPDELNLHRKLGVALPRLCFNCRHRERLAQRNPLRLWHSRCQCAGAKSENGVYQNTAKHSHGDGHCPNEFETSYAPDRPEIVYCEQCYQQEVI